jgi:hypothetical protein
MVRLISSVCVVGLLALTGCGGGADAPTQQDYDHGNDVVGATSPESPNFVAAPYPGAPFGTQLGSVIDNFDFLGWHEPVTRAYDTNAFEKVQLSDFYDPDGSKGIKAIMINVSAVWCSVCKAEYAGQIDGKSLDAHYQEYAPKGVVFIGALFEDASNPPKPATPQNLQSWGDKYNVSFPMVLDPGFKFGAFFTADATPMNLVIDARTMKITGKVLGGDMKTLWSLVDKTIAQ